MEPRWGDPETPWSLTGWVVPRIFIVADGNPPPMMIGGGG
jgi:hypothetical protein